MKKLIYPLSLVILSLFAAAIITTATAMTLASYYKADKNESNLAAAKGTAQQLAAIR